MLRGVSQGRTTTRQQIPWLRIGADAPAIVVSILLAFAIDAAWERRGEYASFDVDDADLTVLPVGIAYRF